MRESGCERRESCVIKREKEIISAVCLKSNRFQPLDGKVMFWGGKNYFEVKFESLDQLK